MSAIQTFVRSTRPRLMVCASAFALLAMSGAAQAQTVAIEPATVPLNEYNCQWDFNPPSNDVNAQCAVDGSLTFTPVDQVRTNVRPNVDRVETYYDVQFSGNLQVDGVPVVTGTPFTSPGFEDAEFYFNTTGQTVNVDSRFTAITSRLVSSAAPNPAFEPGPEYFRREDMVVTVNAIDVMQDGTVNTADGGEYEFNLNSLDPTAITNNSVALGGNFQGTSGSGDLQFGRLSGTATLLTGNLLTPYPDYTAAENVALLSGYQLDYAVMAEVTTSLGADGLITPRVEVSNGIEMNGSRITGLGAGVAPTDAVNVAQLQGEAATRAAADTQLATAITDEAAARAAGDTALATAIADEATTRAAADTQLATAISDEAATRAAADTQLANAITIEAQTRAQADTVIVAALEDEVMTRQQVDFQLSQRIQNQEAMTTTLAANLASEQSARIAADAALGQRIDTLDTRVDVLESRIDQFDDRVASAAAVATAMSGNAFLPDMKFNLTANVGTYDGAHAGSLQIGALVTDHVAINAGIATGFNRGGKTAARAGVTVGF